MSGTSPLPIISEGHAWLHHQQAPCRAATSVTRVDILNGSGLTDFDMTTARPSRSYPLVGAQLEMAVLHRPSTLRGRITRFTGDAVEVRDSAGAKHMLRNRPGAFAVNGETVTLVRPVPAAGAAGTVGPTGSATRRSAAGAIVAVDQKAHVARASRLWVEGDHDARLVERIWGDELREMAVVVEPLGGLDNLVADIDGFGPGPGRSLVVLADHLVEGSKEQRIAARVDSPHVLVVGHRYVDIWQCVRAKSVGIDHWPDVPRGEDWKAGVCRRLGWSNPREGWQRVLTAANDFSDLDTDLVNALELALDHFAAEEERLGAGIAEGDSR